MFLNSLKRYFTTGLLALLPLAAAVWVIVWLFRWLQDIVLRPFYAMDWIGFLFGQLPEGLLLWIQGAIGLIVTFAAVCLLGWLATNVAGRWFFRMVDALVKRVPLASQVYSFVQGLIDNLRMMSAGYFQRVVLVEYPRKGTWALGFVSRELEGSIQRSIPGDRMAVFVPTSPNPTSGFIVVTASDEVLSLDITPEQALKFIVSGGVLMPDTDQEAEPQEATRGSA